MTFKIICPHCQKEISDKDFLKSEQSMAHLQHFFTSKEEEYKKELQATWEMQQKPIIEAQLKTQENNINMAKQKELDVLKQQINALQIINKTNDEKINTILREQELSLRQQHQLVVDKLQAQINDLNIQTKNFQSALQIQLKTQENNINMAKQKELDVLKQQINDLITQKKNFEAMLQTQLTQKELLVLKDKQLEIDNIKNQNQEQEKALVQKINDLTLKLEQGRTIKSGILGSNLENDFERNMNTFYLSDNFEKTTKAINGRKPDFMLTVLNPRDEKKTMGKILFELKNQEKLVLNDVEAKLAKELKEWNADFGLIIWTAAHAPFVHSKNYNNIFIVNTDFEILILIVNVLKLLINKRYNLEHDIEIKVLDEQMMEKFKIWMKEDFNTLIGKAMGEFTKFESNIDKLKKTTDDLTKIKDQLKQIVIDKIEIKLKSF